MVSETIIRKLLIVERGEKIINYRREIFGNVTGVAFPKSSDQKDEGRNIDGNYLGND